MNAKAYKDVMDRIEIDEKCKEELFNTMDKKEQKKFKIKGSKLIPVCIAAVILTCTGTAAASELGVFDKLNAKKNRVVTNDYGDKFEIDKYDDNNYEIIGQNAVTIDTPITAETENLSVTVESVYCDGANIILGLTAVFDKPDNIETAEKLVFDQKIDINGESYSTYIHNENIIRFGGNLILDEGSENTYTGNISFTLSPECRITEPTTVELTLINFVCLNYLYKEYGTLDDKITLDIDIVPDTSKIVQCGAYEEKDGFAFKIYEVSPAMITIGIKYPDFYDKAWDEFFENLTGDETEDEDVPASPVTMFYDENGEIIKPIGMWNHMDYGDGMSIGCLASSDTSSITVRFADKNHFDENGEPILLKEITVNINS